MNTSASKTPLEHEDRISVTVPPFPPVQGEREETAALSSGATSMCIEATVEGAIADVASGADSIPKSRQAGRSAPADRLPVRFTAVARADVNEPGTIVPRRCDGRPKDQRICPQADPK